MLSSSFDRHEIELALLSVVDQYGAGVPLEAIRALPESDADQNLPVTSSPRLYLVVSKEEGSNEALLQLLQRIVEKGLELSWSDVVVVSPDPAKGDSDVPAVSAADVPVIVFGVAEHLSWTHGVSSTKILPTVGLSAINGDSSIKRQFWLRLQSFRGVI